MAVHQDIREPVIQGLVDRYKASTDKHDQRYLLSLVSPYQSREKTMARFECTEHACKAANLKNKLLNLPSDFKAAATVSRISKETASHAEIFMLRDDNVLRAAHGNGRQFTLLRLMNRHRLLVKCVVFFSPTEIVFFDCFFSIILVIFMCES